MAEMKAVRFDRYGDVDVLDVRTVPRPVAAGDRVLVKVRAAGINPGEAAIRKGLLHDRWPATFPSGQGSDLAGIVAEIGESVSDFRQGDEVLGFTNERCSQAEFVSVPAGQLAGKPSNVPWEVAGSLFVAGSTAYAAVRAVGTASGDTIVVAGAAGGVGALAVQLAKRAGATVLGIASAANNAWLSGKGVVPVNYGDDLASRLTAAAPSGKVHAFLDFFGAGYVELAVAQLEVELKRINTTIDFAAAQKFGTRSAGSGDAADIQVIAELADLIEAGELEVPIEKVYRLQDVRDAYRDLEKHHTRGKIALRP